MNLLHLRYFVELAATQHYTRAAERLCITQPSLSHAIAQLEAELGVPLFEKNGRGTALSPFGKQFLLCAQQTLGTLDEGVEALRRVGRGEGLIRLGLLRPLGIHFVPDLAERFLKAHPGQNIRFSFHSGVSGELLKGLEERRYDMIFSSAPPEGLQLTSVAVAQQDLVLIVPQQHPLGRRHVVDLAEAAAYPQVCFSKGTGLRDVIDGLFEKIGCTPEIALETQEDQVVAGLVAHGFGVAVVPYMELLHQLDVRILQLASPAWERKFCLIHDARAYQTPAAASFRAFVLAQCAPKEGAETGNDAVYQSIS